MMKRQLEMARGNAKWLVVVLGLHLTGLAGLAQENIGQIPAGEERSKDYTVQVEGRDIPVYAVKVAPPNPARHGRPWMTRSTPPSSSTRRPLATSTCGPVAVTVTCPGPITSAKILPSSLKIVPAVAGQKLTFSLTQPKPVTIEVNGNWVGALHLFANPPEASAPRPDDPNVIYFGPGVHEVAGLTVSSGKTVYVAAGAVVKGTADRRGPVFTLQGEQIVLRGRGVIDGSLCPTHARNLLMVRGKDITIEGVIFRDSSVWTIPIRRSDRVTVKNAKLLGYRANSDGIDLCNSRDVTIEDCFIRTLDDLIGGHGGSHLELAIICCQAASHPVG